MSAGVLQPWAVKSPEAGSFAAVWQQWEADTRALYQGNTGLDMVLKERARYLCELAPVVAEVAPWSLEGLPDPDAD